MSIKNTAPEASDRKLRFKTLGAFIPWSKQRDRGWAHAMNMSMRADVPRAVIIDNQRVAVPADLLDEEGRLGVTSSGHLVTGGMLPEDTVQAWAYSAFTPMWFLVSAVLVMLLGIVQTLTTAVGAPWVAQALMWAIVPLWLYCNFSILRKGWGVANALMMGFPLYSLMSAVQSQMGGFSGYTVALSMILPAIAPLIWMWQQKQSRAWRLYAQSRKSAFGLTGKFAFAHMDARVQQAIGAIQDTSPVMVIGVCMGVLTKKWSGFAGDKHKELVLTMFSLFRHFLALGRSGTGKTSRFIRPILAAWILSKNKMAEFWGGGLVMDGKAALAKEICDSYPDRAKLLEPGVVTVSLTEGLAPEMLASTLFDLQSGKKDDQKVWDKAAFRWVLAAAVISDAADKLELEENRAILAEDQAKYEEALAEGRDTSGFDLQMPEPIWPYTFERCYYLTNNLGNQALMLGDADKFGESRGFAGVARWLRAKAPGAHEGLLGDALDYVETEIPGMDPKIISSILFTASTWFATVMSNEKARVWAMARNGLDITDCLKGEVFGLNVPAAVYGRSGRVINMLLKKRVLTAVKNRPADWRTNGSGHKPFMLCMDEVQALLTPDGDESELLPMARSLGMACLAATQSVESINAAMGKTEAAPILDVFSNWGILRASENTYKWAQAQLGVTESPRFDISTTAIDYLAGAKAMYSGPAYDPMNPDRDRVRTLMFRNGLGTTGGGFMRGFDKLKEGLRHNSEDAFVRHGSWVREPVVTDEDFGAYLKEPGVALIKILRGEVDRYDFCTTEAVFPENSKKPAVAPIIVDVAKEEIEPIDSTGLPTEKPTWLAVSVNDLWAEAMAEKEAEMAEEALREEKKNADMLANPIERLVAQSKLESKLATKLLVEDTKKVAEEPST